MNQHKAVLDLGCGEFDTILKLLSHVEIERIVGVDDDQDDRIKSACECQSLENISRELSKYFERCVFYMDSDLKSEIHKVEFVPSNIIDYLRNSAKKFDIVIIRNVLHYFINFEQRSFILSKIRLILNSKGLILVTVANIAHPIFSSEGSGKKTFTEKDLLEELSLAGFVDQPVLLGNDGPSICCIMKVN